MQLTYSAPHQHPFQVGDGTVKLRCRRTELPPKLFELRSYGNGILELCSFGLDLFFYNPQKVRILFCPLQVPVTEVDDITAWFLLWVAVIDFLL